MASVFLSPSTQYFNKYIIGGNERDFMNALADRMEPYLLSSGITFARNDPNRDVRAAIAASNALNMDVHLALHSNAAGAAWVGRARGVEMYYSPRSEESRRLATILANNMEYVYPDSHNIRIIPTTTLGEVTQTRSVAVLAEIGFHDNWEDAVWIRDNLDYIAVALVRGLCDYFGIPFVEPGPVYTGVVVTDGSNLNIRSLPSAASSIVGVIPYGGYVDIFGRTGDWYIIRYNNITGYAFAEFIQTSL